MFPSDGIERPVGELRLVGPLPPVADWGLSALLDGNPTVSRFASIEQAIPVPRELDSRPDVLVVGFRVCPDPLGPIAVAVRGGPGNAGADLVDGLEDVLAAKGPDVALLELDSGGRDRLDSQRVDSVSEGAYIPHARYEESVPSRWRFLAQRCSACAAVTFPMRAVCRGCGRSERLTTIALPREGGTIVALTEIGRGGQPTEFDRYVDAVGPYRVGLIDLAYGVRATLMVSDDPGRKLRIGGTVRTVLRRLYPMEGEWRYGRKIVPMDP